jgi:hypothetical protein
MDFKIITDSFQDTTIKVFIVNMLKFFEQNNTERISKLKDKEEKIKLFQDLVDYIESGLKSKYSLNFNIFINEYPSYVLKYEKKSMLILRYESFDFIVFKTPHTCIPAKFIKQLDDKQVTGIEKYLTEKRESLANDNLKLIKYYNKSMNGGFDQLKQWDDKKLQEVVLNNIAYFTVATEGKDITDLALAIQYDLSKESKEYE